MELLESIYSFLQAYYIDIVRSLLFLAGVIPFYYLWKQWKLRNPVKIFFLVPRYSMHDLKYIVQDEREHLTREIILPSNRESLILIWYRPKLNYHEIEQYIEFKAKDGGNISKKPMAISYYNPFVLEGKTKKGDPLNNENHYIDWWRSYHILTDKDRLRDEVYTSGYIVQTYDKGDYDVNVEICTPTRKGKSKHLKIKVRDEFDKQIPCVKYKTRKLKTKIIKPFLRKHTINFRFPYNKVLK